MKYPCVCHFFVRPYPTLGICRASKSRRYDHGLIHGMNPVVSRVVGRVVGRDLYDLNNHGLVDWNHGQMKSKMNLLWKTNLILICCKFLVFL